jgi:hypothetical protein
MANAVLDSDVKAILDTTIDTNPFIMAASLLVTQYLGSAGLSENLLFELTRWLAAHLACIRDPRFLQVKTDTMGLTYQQAKPGTGLHATSYGAQCALLDPTGILEVAMSTKRASIHFD